MTVYLAITEYERVYLGDEQTKTGERDAGRLMIAPKHFRQLERFDEYHAGSEGELVFDWKRRWFRPTHWVGVMQVGNLTVEVLPKIDRRRSDAEGEGNAEGTVQFSRTNLLYMLSLTGMVPMRERDIAAQSVRKAAISETLISLFADRLMSELARGVSRTYVTRRDNLKVLRGKLIFSQHIKHNVARRDRFFVEHDDFLPDTLMNQIFKATCTRLRDVTHQPATQEKLNYCLMALAEVSVRMIRLDDFERIVESRQNQRFADTLRFCQMILAGQAPTARAGRLRTFALLFDMNVVFEQFVAEFMRHYVIRDAAFPGATLHAQSKDVKRYLLWREHSRERGEVRLRPDIVVRGLGTGVGAAADYCVVMDTKWKRLDGSRSWRQGTSQADLYQLFAYAHRYEARHSVLLYPWVDGIEARDMIVPPIGSGQKVHLRFVRLDHDLGTKQGRVNLADELRQMLQII